MHACNRVHAPGPVAATRPLGGPKFTDDRGLCCASGRTTRVLVGENLFPRVTYGAEAGRPRGSENQTAGREIKRGSVPGPKVTPLEHAVAVLNDPTADPAPRDRIPTRPPPLRGRS